MPNRVNMLIDIHCHLLPGLDDGAATLDDALAMATMAVADGIQTIIATPHQLGSHASLSGDTIRAAVRRFQRVLDQRRVPLRVLPGADVRIEPDLPRKIRTGEVVTLADRRRHVLLELPHDVYVPLDRLLADLRSAGLVGILSHPERNRGILRQPSVLRPLVENGCLLQVTAGSLTGLFGLQIKHFSESLIEQGLVHFIASDAHDTVRRPLSLRPAFQRTKELAGIEAAERLFHRNPAAVAAGQNVSSHCQKSATLPWAGWLRRTFSSEPASPSPI
jgi:protein-tyrosine phosphatase